MMSAAPRAVTLAAGVTGVGAARGAAKKQINGLPREFAKSQAHPPTSGFFFLYFFWVSFCAFFGKGSSKTPLKYVCKKFMSKTFSKTISMPVSPRFSFVLSRFQVLSDGS
jgi:hypothetical protein